MLFRDLTGDKFKNAPDAVVRVESRTNRVFYCYPMGESCAFRFDTFAEVGQPVQPVFLDIIAENDLTIETVDTNDYPYVFDRLVTKGAQ